MKRNLISKNVAMEVTEEISQSIVKVLVGNKLGSFESLYTVVRNALESSLLKILTPGKSTDLLNQITKSKMSGQIYKYEFIFH